jgi:hypothetical protein
VDISSADHTFTIKTIAGIHNASATAGTLTGRLIGDSADSVYYIPAGETQLGCFSVVRKTGTTLTTANLLRGLSPHGSDS